MVQIWINLIQWLTTLTERKLLVFLLSLLITLLSYSRWELKNENTRLAVRIDHINSANDSLLQIAENQTKRCEELRLKALEESNNYWKEKFEKMEERIHNQYKEIREIKTDK